MDKHRQATKECHSEDTDDTHMHYDDLQDDIGFIMDNVFGESNMYTEDSDSDLNTLSDSDTHSCFSDEHETLG